MVQFGAKVMTLNTDILVMERYFLKFVEIFNTSQVRFLLVLPEQVALCLTIKESHTLTFFRQESWNHLRYRIVIGSTIDTLYRWKHSIVFCMFGTLVQSYVGVSFDIGLLDCGEPTDGFLTHGYHIIVRDFYVKTFVVKYIIALSSLYLSL